MIHVFNLGENISIFLTQHKNYPVIWVQKNIQKETGVLRLPIYAKLILKQHNIFVKNVSHIVHALKDGSNLNIDLGHGGSVAVSNSVLKLTSTTIDGKEKSIQLNQLQVASWMRKSDQIEEIIASFCPGGGSNEIVFI